MCSPKDSLCVTGAPPSAPTKARGTNPLLLSPVDQPGAREAPSFHEWELVTGLAFFFSLPSYGFKHLIYSIH